MTQLPKSGNRRIAAGAFSIVICALALVGFSNSAHAVCTKPKVVSGVSTESCGGGVNPPPPHPISGTAYNATVSGTATPSSNSVNAETTLANQAGTLQSVSTYNNNTFKVWMPHTYVKATKYTSNGANYLRVYVSTQSDYAPNGDSGTFVFDHNGNLVSGNASALSRIRGEVQQADPQVVAQMNGIVGWFQDHWSQITSCATFAGGIAAGIGGIVAIAGSGGAIAPALLGLGGALGGAGAIAQSETKCF